MNSLTLYLREFDGDRNQPQPELLSLLSTMLNLTDVFQLVVNRSFLSVGARVNLDNFDMTKTRIFSKDPWRTQIFTCFCGKYC